VRLLLDTHVLLWWLRDDPILGSSTRALIADEYAVVLFSLVSCWEASVKHRIGKMDITGTSLKGLAIEAGFTPIGLDFRHIEQLELLPKVEGHRDPFDHLLLVQTKLDADALVTHDRALPQYGVRCIGVR
jgi:PIN domain nuclease of toxin-antitoxin system